MSLLKIVFLWVLSAMIAQAGRLEAQMPVPALPQTYIDTTYNTPVGGKTWHPHSSADLKSALTSANPADVIVLDAKTTYEGNFVLPVKENPDHKWIYLISSNLASLPAPGTRVSPDTDSANMPKIVTGTVSPAIRIPPGGSYYRLAGLELTSSSNAGCRPDQVPRINCWSYQLIYAEGLPGKPLPDSITIDRCYVHGSPTQDVRQGILANGSNIAVIDSYFSDIHQNVFDSQAILAYNSPGPLKIVNNFLSATSEDVMFGGAGGKNNQWIPSDIEVRNNHFFKPLEWAQAGSTLSAKKQWVVKNHLEFKSGRRALVDGNLMENNWASGQTGAPIVLTVRTTQSGDIAVVDDISITNNVLKNTPAGFSTLSRDYACGTPSFAQCSNPGEAKRIKIYNNLILFRDPKLTGGARNIGIQMALGMTDLVFQHNTTVTAPGTSCWNSIFFNGQPGVKPPWQSTTTNVWILDNILCRPPSGDGGRPLAEYMGNHPPLDSRFRGNVMFLPGDAKEGSYPRTNVVSKTPIKYTDSTDGKFALTAPVETKTTDGKPPGVDLAALNSALSARAQNQPAGHEEKPQGDVLGPKR
jgi:hypothetical protein